MPEPLTGNQCASWLTVRAAARVLGVHENTIRNWEKRGILRALRLPGSGFRRFPRGEVLGLRDNMAATLVHHRETPAGEDNPIGHGGG